MKNLGLKSRWLLALILCFGCAACGDGGPKTDLSAGTTMTGGTVVLADTIPLQTTYFDHDGNPLTCPVSIGPDSAVPTALPPPAAASLLTPNGVPLSRPALITMPLLLDGGGMQLLPPVKVTNRLASVLTANWFNSIKRAEVSFSPVGAEGITTVRFDLFGLIPNGYYTVWLVYQTGASPALTPDQRFALTAFGGLPNGFVTDENGEAVFSRRVPMDLFTVGGPISSTRDPSDPSTYGHFFNMTTLGMPGTVPHDRLLPTDRFSFIIGLHSTQQTNANASVEGMDFMLSMNPVSGVIPDHFLGFGPDGNPIFDGNRCPFPAEDPSLAKALPKTPAGDPVKITADNLIFVPGMPGVSLHRYLRTAPIPHLSGPAPREMMEIPLNVHPLNDLWFDDDGVLTQVGDPSGTNTSGAPESARLLNQRGVPLNRLTAKTVFGPAQIPIALESRVPNVTLGDVLASTGSVRIEYDGTESARVTVSASGLFSEGLHTVWYMVIDGITGMPVALAPLGGLPNYILADANGSGQFATPLPVSLLTDGGLLTGVLDLSGGTHPALLPTDWIMVISGYHSDGQGSLNQLAQSMLLGQMPIMLPGMRPYDFHPHLHAAQGIGLFRK